jgi:hypothetical protein
VLNKRKIQSFVKWEEWETWFFKENEEEVQEKRK